MALVKDPKTGAMVDDGTGPGTAALNMASLFPAKPEHESTSITETRAPSAAVHEAELKGVLGEGQARDAIEQGKDLATAESGVQADTAEQKAAAIQRQIDDDKEAERKRAEQVAQHQRDDHAEIEEMGRKRIAAGHAKADYWKGNAQGEFLAAVLGGIDRAASAFRGDNGPTGVERILNAKIAAHEQALVSEYEASKEGHELKRADRDAYEKELDRRRIQANNQSLLELKVLDARTDKALAALGPERAAAAAAEKNAAVTMSRADIQQRNGALYDRQGKFSETDRSPTSAAGAGAAGNRPLSAETTDIVSSAAEYQRLAARQRELIAANGGSFPTIGPEASEFDKNERAMAAAQQKQFGKSDNDAKLAAAIQGSPTEVMGVPVGKVLSHLPLNNTVDNYLRGLDVNAQRLAKSAETRASLETTGRANAPAATDAALGKPPARAEAAASPLAGASVQRLAAGMAAAARAGDKAAVEEYRRELARRKK